MATLTQELLKREFRKHFELAETARHFAAQVKAVKEHYRAPGGDASKAIHIGGIGEDTPEYYFVRIVHFAENSLLKAQSICASYNHRSAYGCNKGTACTFKYHICAFCHKDSHVAFARQKNGTHSSEWYYTCPWLRGFEAERKQMIEQFALDARTAEGLECLVRLSRPVPRPRRTAAPASPAQIGLNNRFAGGTETESEEEEAAPSEAHEDAWEEPQGPACPAPPSPADPERTVVGRRARSTARAVSGPTKARKRGSARRASGAVSSRPRAATGGNSVPSALAPREEAIASSSSAAAAWPTALESGCPAPPLPADWTAAGRARSAARAVSARKRGSARGASGAASGRPRAASESEVCAGSDARAAEADGKAEAGGSSLSVASALAPREGSSSSASSSSAAWPTPLESACPAPLERVSLGAGKKSKQRSRSAVGAASSSSAAGPGTGSAPRAPQESAHQAPVALVEAGAGSREPSPPPHEANSRDTPRGEQEVVEMPARAEGIPKWLVREMLGRREEQLQESQEEVAQLKARIASLEQSLRSRDKRLAMLESRLESVLLGEGTGEVLGDTGSSAGASRAASSTTPQQWALINEKARALTLEVKNRVKEADKHPEMQLNNPGDLLNLVTSRIEEEGDAARRGELSSRLEVFREQARAANAARHSNMRSTEPAGPGDMADFDGTWRSVNGQRSIRDVQFREDEAEITTLERLALFFHTEQPLKLELQGLGLTVQDEVFSEKISRSTVAFASEDDLAGFQGLEEAGRLPRCIQAWEPYKYLEKWPRQPWKKEAAVRFKNMYEGQPVEEFLWALTEFGPVQDVCVKKTWESTGNAFLGFVEFRAEGEARRLLDSRFLFIFKGKKHLVLNGPSKYLAFRAWV